MQNPKYKQRFYDELNEKLKKYLIDVGPGMRPTKNGYVPMTRDSICVKTGYDLISPTEGKQSEYEFGKSITNMVYALMCRLFVSKVSAD